MAAVRATIARFATKAGAPQAIIDGVKLAVSEAATNVIVHAYRESGEPGSIYLEANVQGAELQVSVADEGPGLRRRDDSPGLGLGLAIINRLADKIELLQGGQGGLRILMRFSLQTRAG